MPRTATQNAPKLGDLFLDFGTVTAAILDHPECPSEVAGVLSEMMSNIDGEASKYDRQQSLRTQTEARTILPNNLTILMLEGRKKGGKSK